MKGNDMRALYRAIGVLLVLLALAALAYGVYFDIRYMLVGGVIEIIEGAKANPVDSSRIAWGVFRVAYSSVGAFVGFWVGFILSLFGFGLIASKS